MKRRYMRYLYEAEKVPRRTLSRKKRDTHLKRASNPVIEEHSRLSEVHGSFLCDARKLNPTLESNLPVASSTVRTHDYTTISENLDCSWSDCNEQQENISFNVQNKSNLALDHGMENCDQPPSADTSSDCRSETTKSIGQTSESYGSTLGETFYQTNAQSSSTDQPTYKETLCPCSQFTAGDVCLMVLSLGLRHSLSWEAQVDILKIIKNLFPKGTVPHSKHLYFNYIAPGRANSFQGNIPTQCHFFCGNCQVLLEKSDNSGNRSSQHKRERQKELLHCECGEVTSCDSAPYFMSLSLETQFKNVLQDPQVASALLTHRFDYFKNETTTLRDIYDGAQYKKYFLNGGLLSNPHNFSYSFNTDGVKAGQSCSVNRTMWPIYVTINEIPFKLREKFVLLAGLYVGKSHPHMNSFLFPFVKQANYLSSCGMTWRLPSGESVKSKVIPLCSVVDSPARCSMVQINSFNSVFGCTFCYQKTERTQKGRKFSGRKRGESRTHESTLSDMDAADQNNENPNIPKKDKRQRGVWGTSVLRNLKYFNLVDGFVPDYMHCLLLGVAQQHTELLLDPQTKSKIWNMNEDIGIDHLVTLIDHRLKSITPPRCITRLPQGLSDRELWKASQWRAWLIFYSLVCCKELKNKYLEHFAMLSTAANILLQSSITLEEFNISKILVLKYVFLYEEYFGKTSMNYCVHLLLHVIEGVKNYGPLFTHNAFLYEGQNRYLLQMLSSPYKVVKQLTSKYLIFSSIPDLCTKLATCEQTADICETLVQRRLKRFVNCSGLILLGNGKCFIPSTEETNCLLDVGFSTTSGRVFDRFLWKGMRFSNADSSLGKRNNDSFFLSTSGKVCQIQKIVHFNSNVTSIFVKSADIENLPSIESEHVKVTHIFEICSTFSDFSVEQPDIIDCKLVPMFLDYGKFVAKVPFGCLGD